MILVLARKYYKVFADIRCRALRGKTMSPPQAEHRAFGGAGSDSGDHPWGNRHEIRARSAVGK